MEQNNLDTFQDFKVEFISFGDDTSLTVSDITFYDTELETNITCQMDYDPEYDVLYDVELHYAHKTSNGQQVYLRIWNVESSRWEVVDDTVYSSFSEQSYDVVADYIDENNNIIFQYVSESDENEYNYELMIDKFQLKYDKKDFTQGISDEIMAEIEKTITDDLLNRYDEFNQYQQIYDITIEFDYLFDKNCSYFTHVSNFTYDDQEPIALNGDGNQHHFAHTYSFDSQNADSFNVSFDICNGQLDFSNMNYTITFKALDLESHHKIGQSFEESFPEETELSSFAQHHANIMLSLDYEFSTINDGHTYYNHEGRTNKFEIIPELNFQGLWYTADIHAISTSESGTYTFNISDYMKDNHLKDFQDFNITYNLIGDESYLSIDDLTLTFERNIQEQPAQYYRIIDLTSGQEDDWIEFTPDEITTLSDLTPNGILPSNFSIEYKVIDRCGNDAVNSTYNNGYRYITYSPQIGISFQHDDNSIDLDSSASDERQISFTGAFGDNSVEVELNGFNYGTISEVGGVYTLDFGTENTYDNMLLYSDSLMSDDIYSNINPYAHICWDTRMDGYYGVTKHVLLDGDINIVNPLTNNANATLDLAHLYDRGFSLPNFARVGQAYYYNTSEAADEPFTPLSYYDYLVEKDGTVSFPDYSEIHNIYNHSDEVANGEIYFEYTASDFASELRLNNADGFFINVSIPATYYRHTTIEKMIVSFNDVFGNTYSKVYYDLDLRQYFMDDVKSEYENTIFGFGKLMTIPLYIDMNELKMSNKHNNILQDISLLESVSFDIEDSGRWPGSFVEEYDTYNVLNLPYQRFIVHDIRLYNYPTDTIKTDENGYITSNITITAPDYNYAYATDTVKFRRQYIELTDFSVFNGETEIPIDGSSQVEYSDELVMYFTFNNSMERIPFEEMSHPIIQLVDSTTGEMVSMSACYFINKYDESAPDGYYHNYYYARFPMPTDLGTYSVRLASNGTQLHSILFDEDIYFDFEVIQEDLNDEQPIYLEEDVHHLRYGIDTLSLKGCVVDNDRYTVEDEVYDYSWENAYDGESSYTLDFASPYGDDNFINTDEVAIYYLTETNEKRPLYVNYGDDYFKDNEILDPDQNPSINYVNNEFIITMYWNPDSQAFPQYDTKILISYEILKGKAIQPTSYTTFDAYNNSLHTNLVEIPFRQYDMIADEWIFEDEFIETVQLEKQLYYKEIDYTGDDTITITGPKYQEGDDEITLGILEFNSLYRNNSETLFYRLMSEDAYNWSINANGELEVELEGDQFSVGDTLQIGYHSYLPLTFTHPISEQNIYSFNVSRTTAYTEHYQFDSSHYVISDDGYRMYPLDIYNTLLVNNFSTTDQFRLHYHSNYSQQIDLSENLILSLQNDEGEYVAIDTVELDSFGFFDYKQSFIKSGLNLYLGFGKTINNLKLSYLPSEVNGDIISYEHNGNDIYPYKESTGTTQWEKFIRVTTEGKKTKLKMVDFAQQPMVVSQSFRREREYLFNRNPLEALEAGEDFTSLHLDVLAQEDYTFTYKLTDWDDTPLSDAVVWMHIGFMPKSKTGFINERAVVGDGTNIYYDALGTELLTSKGPGDGPNKMFGRPLTYEIEYPNTECTSYGPYMWEGAITDKFGEVSFDIRFDQDFMRDFADIFGTMEGINSIDDVVMYHRVFTAPFEWDKMKIDNPERYVCSKDGSVFDGFEGDGDSIPEYDEEQQMTNDGSYIEGLIRFKKNLISLGAHDHLSYDLPEDIFDGQIMPDDLEDLTIHISSTKSDPIPTGATYTMDDLTRVYSPSELEPTSESIFDPDDDHYYYAMVDIINPSGVNVLNYTTQFEIEEMAAGGRIIISNTTMAKMLPAMGPGISTVRMYIKSTEYYRRSPTIHVPLEIRPANYVRFGEKNTLIDLIDPFITSWGSVYDDQHEHEHVPFESNYPVLSGAFWMEPYFNESTDEPDVSVYDEVSIDLFCSLYNDDGTKSPFALRKDIPLKSGNIDGIMTFNMPLGPEEAFLMDTECDLNLSVNLNYWDRQDLYEHERDINILLLDLRLESNPSSSTPTTYWSLYEDEFESNTEKVSVKATENIETATGDVTLGEYDPEQNIISGQPYFEIYSSDENENNEYGLSEESALFDLLALSQIVPLAVVGTKNGRDYEFIPNVDWQPKYEGSPYLFNQSLIEFIGITPDEYTMITIYYEFLFNFGTNYYANISVGPTTNLNESSIELQFGEGFLPPSNESVSPMYTQFTQECIGDGSQPSFIMDYGLEGLTEQDYIIYNELELTQQLGAFITEITSNHINITFTTPPENTEEFSVDYGIRSQYYLGYGFQKLNQSYSDSVRMITNNEESTAHIINERGTDEPLSTVSVDENALYVDLDGVNESTQLVIEGVPLLYAPELNFSVVLDEVLMDYLSTFTGEPNTLTLDFSFIPTDDSEFTFSPLKKEVLLDYTDLYSYYEEGENNSIYINFNKEFGEIYNIFGPTSVDIIIDISQVGNNEHVLPYLIFERMDYLCDTHLVEMYDTMPLDRSGNIDYKAVINTPHYFQIFSMPFRDDELYPYLPDSPFNLLEHSKVTVSLSDLPHSRLASLDVSQHADYDLNVIGNQTTIDVNDANYNMIPNLALFTDAYNIDETTYQQGFLDLYYGEGTEVDGEQYYTAEIGMDYNPEHFGVDEYQSVIDDQTPTSWQDTYTFTNKFLSTGGIEVFGDVFYHEMFNISVNSTDIVPQEDVIQLVDTDQFDRDVYFGIRLPTYTDITSIDAVRTPEPYILSVQGFPAGYYRDIYGETYIHNITTTDNDVCTQYNPSEDAHIGTNYYEYISTSFGQYIIFFAPFTEIQTNYTDENHFLMVDYHATEEFEEGEEFIIRENVGDSGTSQIIWDFSYENYSSYNLHPDFTADPNYGFTVEYPALEWDEFDQKYVDTCQDKFIFRPREKFNVSDLYIDGIDIANLSVRYDIPEDQWLPDSQLFGTIHFLIQNLNNRELLEEVSVENSQVLGFITQYAQDSYIYELDYSVLENYVDNHHPNFQILDESYIVIESEYDSDTLRYSLSQTPFNYEYTELSLGQYHINLSINGNFLITSSDQTSWDDYVYSIHDDYIYFAEDANINPQDEITVEYAFKTSPCLLERKEFLMTIYPYSNQFDTPYTSFMGGASSGSQSIHRKSWREMSAGSIISPFEYSLSIDNMYSLYLGYRLNQRDYFEEKFTVNYANDDFSFDLFERMDDDVADRISILNNSATVFYYDYDEEMQFLPREYYEIDYEQRTVTLLPDIEDGYYDNNPITASNQLREFYVSFSPVGNENDIEIIEHHFIVDRPTHTSARQTIDVSSWETLGENTSVVIPNLDAFWRMDEQNSDFSLYNCYAAQIGTVLGMGQSLRYNISLDLQTANDDLLTAIHNGDYPRLYINTRIENMESLSFLNITLFNEQDIPISEQFISRENLQEWANQLIIDLPTGANTLEYITFTPIYREDGAYTPLNTKGIDRLQFAQFEVNETEIDEQNGVEYYSIPLKHEIIEEPTNLEVAYIFNDKLQHLSFPENASYKIAEEMGGQTYLKVPVKYFDPDDSTNSTLLLFEDEQSLIIKYYSPIEKKIAFTLGEFYYEKEKAYHTEDIPTAEFMLINANGTDSQYYDEFTNGYYYDIDLPITPFDTDYTDSYKSQRFEINISELENYADNETGLIDFSHMMFTINDPLYTLTIEQFAVVENDEEPLVSYDSAPFKRLWQYTEFESFEADATPEDDQYQLALNSTPLFYEYPNATWLEYTQIYDEDGYYYSAGLEGDQYALHYNESTRTLTWNENFTGSKEVYGVEFETNLIIEPNTTLIIRYATNDSWKEPIRIDHENINIDTLLVEYAFALFDPYLMGAHDELADIFDPEYSVVQYYQEIFDVYNETDTQTFTLSISDYAGNYSLVDDFANVSVYSVVGIKPDFTSVELSENAEFEIHFDLDDERITVIDLNESDGLDVFDSISIVLNYTQGPLSSYSELFLTEAFWNDTLGTYNNETLQESFYSSLDISFSSTFTEGVERVFAGEAADLIASEYTSLNAISYCRNPAISSNNKFNYYGGSEMISEFEIVYDPFNIIYHADIDDDGNIDYKQTVDIDKDYTIDVIKYGCENEDGMLVWHTIIQEFHKLERSVDLNEGEKLETLWFDLRDSTIDGFAGTLLDPFNLQGSLQMGLQNSYQLNYFGKKVIESETKRTTLIKRDYYSIRLDHDRDGFADQEIVHRKLDATIEHQITKTMKFLIAAKPTSICDMLNSKISSFVGGYQEDPLFNPLLTEDVLDYAVTQFHELSGLQKFIFLQCGGDFATVLLTYRKFILHDRKLYTQEIVQDELIYRDWDEGEIVEERIYKDDFSEDEMNPHSELLFGEIMEKNTVTNIDTEQETEVTFDPFVPFGEPSNITWDTPTWGQDNVPIYYDALTVANDTHAEFSTNYYERTVTITLLTRSSVLYAYGEPFSYPGCIHAQQFEVTGVFITPPDGVYVSSDKEAFILDFKVNGHYLYYDSNNFGEGTGDDFYDTVYVLSPSQMADGSYLVYSMVYNYDGKHDVKPYTIVGGGWNYDAKEIFTIAVTSLSYPFCDEIREFFIDQLMNVYTLEEQDSIFELYKSTFSMQKYPMLFAEARRETYDRAWEVFGERMWDDFYEQTFILCTAITIGAILKFIPFTTALGDPAFMLTYLMLTKYFMDEKQKVAAAEEAAQVFYTLDSRPPLQLNDRAIGDRVSRDSALTALQGHPDAGSLFLYCNIYFFFTFLYIMYFFFHNVFILFP